MSWRSYPEVGTLLGMRLVAGALRLFGRRSAAALLWLVSGYYALVARDARRATRDLFERLGRTATLRLRHEHLWRFARASADRLLFLTGRLDAIETTLHGHERVMALKDSRRGALLLGAHLGSFEAMRALAARYDVPLLVVADFRNARRVNAMLAHFAPALRVRLLDLDPENPAAVLSIKDAIERGELVAMLGDRATHREGRDVVVPFLGGRARLPVGPFVLASLLRCPVYFVCALFEPPNRYEVHCVPLAERVELPRGERAAAVAREATRYARVLEDFLRRSPLNWFNFFPFWVDS